MAILEAIKHDQLRFIGNQLYPLCLVASASILILVQNQSYSFNWFLLGFCILFGLIIYQTIKAYQTPLDLPKSKSIFLYVLFLIWGIISLTWTPVAGDSFLTLLVLTSLLLGYINSFRLSETQQRLFSKLLVVLVLLCAGKTIFQAIVDHTQRPKGLFSDWNTNGSYISLLCLAFCGHFLSLSDQKCKTIFWGLLIALASLAIGFTLSRGSILGFSVGMIILLAAARHQKYPLANSLKLLGYIAAGFLLADYLNQSFNETTMLERLAKSGAIESTDGGRAALWSAGWKMYLEKPIFGWGLDMFHWLFPQYRHDFVPDLGQFAHNDYLQILIELGPIGLILILGFIAFFCIENWNLYAKEPSKSQKLENLGLFSGCIAIFTHSIVNFNFYQPSMLVMIGLYMGILAKRHLQVTNAPVLSIKIDNWTSRSGFHGIIALISIIVFSWAGLFHLSLRSAYDNSPNNTPLDRMDKIETAHRLLPYREEYLASFANQVVTTLKLNFSKFTPNDVQILTSNSLIQLEKAIDKNPYRSLNYKNKALLLKYQAKTEQDMKNPEISHCFFAALRLNPFDLETRTLYVNYLGAIDQKELALNVLEQGLNKKYFENYQLGLELLKVAIPLYASQNKTNQIESIKTQIDELLKHEINATNGGYFTLKNPMF